MEKQEERSDGDHGIKVSKKEKSDHKMNPKSPAS
jgi:hypothetical protein